MFTLSEAADIAPEPQHLCSNEGALFPSKAKCWSVRALNVVTQMERRIWSILDILPRKVCILCWLQALGNRVEFEPQLFGWYTLRLR